MNHYKIYNTSNSSLEKAYSNLVDNSKLVSSTSCVSQLLIRSYNVDAHVDSSTGNIIYNINDITNIKNELNIFIHAFKNQRKMYSFTKAWNSYEKGFISDEEMDKIEEKFAVVTKKYKIEEAQIMIKTLLKYLDEEIFDIEELSSILGVNTEVIKLINNKVNEI